MGLENVEKFFEGNSFGNQVSFRPGKKLIQFEKLGNAPYDPQFLAWHTSIQTLGHTAPIGIPSTFLVQHNGDILW